MKSDTKSLNEIWHEEFKGTHPRYMKFDFCNTEIKNQNGSTDAIALPSSLSAINHWFLKWRHVARMCPLKWNVTQRLKMKSDTKTLEEIWHKEFKWNLTQEFKWNLTQEFNGTHLRYVRFDFRNTKIKNQNCSTDATALLSSLSAINHWFLKWRHVAWMCPFKWNLTQRV